jgi:hypothetical protein
VNAARIIQITDQLCKANFTFCVVCVFTLQTGEWCVHNRLFNADFEDKLTPDISTYRDIFLTLNIAHTYSLRSVLKNTGQCMYLIT